VIRACIFIMLSVLEVTQRVPPTCIIKTDFTHGVERQMKPTLHHHGGYGRSRQLFASFRTRTVTDQFQNIEKSSVSLDPTRNCIQTYNYKYKKTTSYNFNSQSDPSKYFHHVVGTGSYTTSTTNMYHKYFTYLGSKWS